jgi:two-component system CheB/CheR fusion protein
VEPFAVVVADATGVIQSWNAEAQRMFGYSADDVIGRTLDVIIPAWGRPAGAAAVFMGQSAAEDLPSLPEL